MTRSSPYTATNLLFHLVAPGEGAAEAAGSPLLTTTVSELAGRVEALRRSGLRPASVADYLGSAPPGPESFTLSFDDAHPSVLDLAAPVLAELGVPATVFVPTGHVGLTERVMGWRELRELASRPGWSLGSHGQTHARASWRLYREDAEAHRHRLVDEARRSRQLLEERLDRPALLYAYPFGEAPAAARQAAAEAGFRAAFTVAPTPAWEGDLLGIPRLDGNLLGPGLEPLAEVDPPPGISVVVPACDRAPVVREVVRRLAEQSYPPDRFEVLVVDDGSRVSLAEALAPWLDGPVRLLRLEGSDRAFRAGQARQAGAEAARLDVLAFLDADVAVDRDFLWHLAYPHGLSPRAVVLGYLSGYNLHDLGHFHDLEEVARAERLSGDALPVVPDRSREPTLRACLDDVHGLAEPWRLAYTGNLSVSKELLRRAGGFSDEFRGWGFEDVDLGVRLHEAGALWIFSRWALGYHVADPAETRGGSPPRNPFRDPSPERSRFVSALENLATLERRHPSHAGVARFCAQVRADVEEICDPPEVVGVEVGAELAEPWPFDWPLHRRWPGGLPLEEIRDRLAYAARLGAPSLYLLGGDVGLRPELREILAEARAAGAREITLETTGRPFASPGLAAAAAAAGLSAAVVEVLAGRGHPTRSAEVQDGVASLRRAGLRLGVKLVLGDDDRAALDGALRWIEELELGLDRAVAPSEAAALWARAALGDDVEVEVWEAPRGETAT